MPPSPYIVERTATTPHSRLPPLPIMATNAVTRRPVGGQAHIASTSVVSVNSVTSLYSDSPGFSDYFANLDADAGADADATPTTIPTPTAQNTPSDNDSTSMVSPPLPPKDPQRSQAREPANALASRDGFQPSPPRTELWRRRSLTSDKAVAFPELQLEKSNGSTASPHKNELPPVPNPLPRSTGNRKPVPLRKDHIPLRGAPQPPDGMGSKLSKLGEKFSKLKHNDNSKKTKANQSEAPSVQPSSGRLPTPEYQRTDKQQPLTPKVMSPISPETPPSDVAPQIPSISESRNTSNTTLVAAKDPMPSLSLAPSEPLTITSSPAMRSPQPKKALPIPILTPELSPSSTSVPTPLSSPGIRGAITFPKQPQRSPPGTVLPALPLNVTHLECYTSHANMLKSSNQLCPVACMVCHKKDSDTRWRCTWCCVSACAGCMQALARTEKMDLQRVVEKTGR